jgi:hypothetical protein
MIWLFGETYSPAVPVLEGSRLVSCCPSLTYLDLQDMQCSAELLPALHGLSRLQDLCLFDDRSTVEGLEVVCQLTQLKDLVLLVPNTAEELLLLQLTQLKQLTYLEYSGPLDGGAGTRFDDVSQVSSPQMLTQGWQHTLGLPVRWHRMLACWDWGYWYLRLKVCSEDWLANTMPRALQKAELAAFRQCLGNPIFVVMTV